MLRSNTSKGIVYYNFRQNVIFPHNVGYHSSVNKLSKRNNCAYINSSASEEAMLSDDQNQEQRIFLNRTNSPVSSEEQRESDSSTDSQDVRHVALPNRDPPVNEILHPQSANQIRPMKSRRVGKGNLGMGLGNLGRGKLINKNALIRGGVNKSGTFGW